MTEKEEKIREKQKEKNDKRKQRRKLNKSKSKESQEKVLPAGQGQGKDEEDEDEPKVEIEYVTQTDLLPPDDPNFSQFASVFAKFQFVPEEAEETASEELQEKPASKPKDEDDDDDEDNEGKKEGGDEEGKISKKKQRKLRRLEVADLKEKAKKPEVVEWVDATASDPQTLVFLKAYKNSVPVPRHWSQKRKYLQGKRGIEKPPFELPEFIQFTGITELRDAVREKEENMKIKSKMRERVQPKMGKLEIDYQKLYDAFFKFQTKPKMTEYGDLYHEGKEYEVRVKEKKPGHLSEDLKAALNIPPGAPPPWLINMQRYGPPPNYPNLKVPGLNAPIPEGAQWGYHPGGWGKPPVDEYGQPLYGDVFGLTVPPPPPPDSTQAIEKNLWGQLEEDQYESESEEEEEEEEESEEEKEIDQEGLETPSGFSSVASGLETPDRIELRKDLRKGDETPDAPKALYTVIPQKESKGGGFMASAHTYDFNAAKKEAKKVGEGVEVALDPSEMENLDDHRLKELYEQRASEKGSEDLSDMVAEHAVQQSKKRKKQSDTKPNKKSKDFKF